jgi:hypothetical protein
VSVVALFSWPAKWRRFLFEEADGHPACQKMSSSFKKSTVNKIGKVVKDKKAISITDRGDP